MLSVKRFIRVGWATMDFICGADIMS